MLVPWTAILAYTFLSFFLGQNGLYARRHLDAESQRLSANLSALEAANRGFHGTKVSLLYDDDALSVFARQLGYGLPEEEFVRVVGLEIASAVELPSDQAIYAVAYDPVSSSTLRLVSLGLAFAALLFLLVQDFYPSREPD